MRRAPSSSAASGGHGPGYVSALQVEGRLRMVETMCGRTDTLCDKLEQVVEIHRQAIERLNQTAAEQQRELQQQVSSSCLVSACPSSTASSSHHTAVSAAGPAHFADLHHTLRDHDRHHRGAIKTLTDRVDAIDRHQHSLDDMHRRIHQQEKHHKDIYRGLAERVDAVEMYKQSFAEIHRALDEKEATQRAAYKTLADRLQAVESHALDIRSLKDAVDVRERGFKTTLRHVTERMDAVEAQGHTADAVNERVYEVERSLKAALGDLRDRVGDVETSVVGLQNDGVAGLAARMEKVEKRVDILVRQQDGDRDVVTAWRDETTDVLKKMHADAKTNEAAFRKCHQDTTDLAAHVQTLIHVKQDIDILGVKVQEEPPRRKAAVAGIAQRLDAVEESVAEQRLAMVALTGGGDAGSGATKTTGGLGRTGLLAVGGGGGGGIVGGMELSQIRQTLTTLAQQVEQQETKLCGYVEAGLAALAKKVEKTVSAMLGTSVEAGDKRVGESEAKVLRVLDTTNQRVEQKLKNYEVCADERFARVKQALEEVSTLFETARGEVVAVAARVDAASPTRHRFTTALDSRVTVLDGKVERLEHAVRDATDATRSQSAHAPDAAVQKQLLQSLATRCGFIERTIRSLQDQITDTRNAAALLSRADSEASAGGAGRQRQQLPPSNGLAAMFVSDPAAAAPAPSREVIAAPARAPAPLSTALVGVASPGAPGRTARGHSVSMSPTRSRSRDAGARRRQLSLTPSEASVGMGGGGGHTTPSVARGLSLATSTSLDPSGGGGCLLPAPVDDARSTASTAATAVRQHTPPPLDRVGSPLRTAAQPFEAMLDNLQEGDARRRESLGLAACASLRSMLG